MRATFLCGARAVQNKTAACSMDIVFDRPAVFADPQYLTPVPEATHVVIRPTAADATTAARLWFIL